MKYAVYMVLDVDYDKENYKIFEILNEHDIEKIDMSEYEESDKETKQIILDMFSDCPYIKIFNSYEKIDEKKGILYRIFAFTMEDSLNIRQQMNLLARYGFSNYVEFKRAMLA